MSQEDNSEKNSMIDRYNELMSLNFRYIGAPHKWVSTSNVKKERVCLRCRKPFMGQHVGNRICITCNGINKNVGTLGYK